MTVSLDPFLPGGSAAAPVSKSDAQRKLICAALADAPSEFSLPAPAEDVQAAINCLKSMGAGIARDGDKLRVSPIAAPASNPLLPCGESGAVLRFLLPVAACVCSGARFIGQGRLSERPILPLTRALTQNGVVFSSTSLPFTISGYPRAGEYILPGDVSSQFISGLLLALPLLPNDSRVRLTSPLVSAPYVKLTLRVLRDFSISIRAAEDGWHIPGSQRYHTPGALPIEGDWSGAACLLIMGALRGDARVMGVNADSAQADRAIIGILRDFGARVAQTDTTAACACAPLTGRAVDLTHTPDLLPVLAVLAAFASGDTVYSGCARLKHKESDRLSAVKAMICALGGQAEIQDDSLIVRGRPLRGGRVNGAGDHRVVMAAAVAAARCREPVIIDGAEAVHKSYPGFFNDYVALGGKIHVL